MLSKSIYKKAHQQKQIQLKLSTIFKQKVIDTHQCFGTFYDADGEKYCAISVLSKYLGMTYQEQQQYQAKFTMAKIQILQTQFYMPF